MAQWAEALFPVPSRSGAVRKTAPIALPVAGGHSPRPALAYRAAYEWQDLSPTMSAHSTGFRGNKAALPSKPCVACGRPMSWRRNWAKNWDEVKYCSERCRRAAPKPG